MLVELTNLKTVFDMLVASSKLIFGLSNLSKRTKIMKHFLLILAVLTAVIYPCHVTAQSPFYQVSFEGNSLPEGWLSEDAGSGQASVLWQVCPSGAVCAPRTYGYYLSRYGMRAFGKGAYVYLASDAVPVSAATPHISRLTTGAVDCSEAAEVWIRFLTHAAVQNTALSSGALLRVSTDLENWESFSIFPEQAPLEIGEQRFTPNPVSVLLDVSNVAAGNSTVYFQWQWTGFQELSWCLDEIALYDEHPEHFRIVWGNEPGQGDFQGGLNEWSVVNFSPGLPAWAWQPGAYIGNALTAPNGYYLGSPSALNGAAILNTDHYLTNGTIPPTPPFPVFDTELISPRINLSGVSGKLILQFYQVARLLNAAPGNLFQTTWSYSLNDGLSWSEADNANEGLGINSPWETKRTRIYLPEEMAGKDSVRIKFRFAGNLYGWGIDDVAILERPDYHMQVANNFYAVSPNLSTPFNLVEPLHFMADVWNRGKETLPEAQLYIEIENTENGLVVFRDSLTLLNLAPDSLFEDVIFPGSFDVPGEAATYRGVYRVKDTQISDSTSWRFEVSDATFARELGSTGAFTPQGSNSYRYGNSFYIPEEAPDMTASAIQFQVGNASFLVNQKVNLILNRLDVEELQSELSLQPWEYTPLISVEYTFLGFEDNQLITVPLIQDGEDAALLEPGKHYFVVLEYEAIGFNQLFISVSETHDFLATYYLYNLLEKPRYVTLLDPGNTGVYNLLGLGASGFGQIPVIRLNVDLLNAVVEPAQRRAEILCWPNPVTSKLNFEPPPGARSFRVTNAEGKPLINASLNGEPVAHISAEGWRNGWYVLEVFGIDFKITTQFLVQR